MRVGINNIENLDLFNLNLNASKYIYLTLTCIDFVASDICFIFLSLKIFQLSHFCVFYF